MTKKLGAPSCLGFVALLQILTSSYPSPPRPAYTACYSSSPHAASLTAALLLCCSPSGHTSFLLSTFTFHMPYTSTQRLMSLLSRHPGRCRLQSCIEKRGLKAMALNQKLQLQQTPSLKEGGDRCHGSSCNPTTALLSPPVNLLHQQSAHRPPAPWKATTTSHIFPNLPLPVKGEAY